MILDTQAKIFFRKECQTYLAYVQYIRIKKIGEIYQIPVVKESIETLNMGTKFAEFESPILRTQIQVRLQNIDEIKVIQDKDSQPVRLEDRNATRLSVDSGNSKIARQVLCLKH